MEKELFEKFRLLSVNEKRNELNAEIVKIHQLLVSLLDNYKYDTISDYDSKNDVNMTEDKYLDNTYEDIIKVRKVLMDYLAWKEQ